MVPICWGWRRQSKVKPATGVLGVGGWCLKMFCISDKGGSQDGGDVCLAMFA